MANDFKQALKKNREGKRHEMETIEGGYYFSPVKYSVEGADAINAVAVKNKNLLKGPALKKVKELAADNDGKVMTTAELLDKLSDEEFENFVSEIKTENIETVELNRLKIKYGLGPNNFGAGVSPEGALVRGGVPDEFVDDLLQNAEIAAEIVGVIQIWNSPLVRKQ